MAKPRNGKENRTGGSASSVGFGLALLGGFLMFFEGKGSGAVIVGLLFVAVGLLTAGAGKAAAALSGRRSESKGPAEEEPEAFVDGADDGGEDSANWRPIGPKDGSEP